MLGSMVRAVATPKLTSFGRVSDGLHLALLGGFRA